MKLQRVLNAAAQTVSNTCKYDRGLRQFRQHELHWLDGVDRVRFRVCVHCDTVIIIIININKKYQNLGPNP